jgi:hypothetical protein
MQIRIRLELAVVIATAIASIGLLSHPAHAAVSGSFAASAGGSCETTVTCLTFRTQCPSTSANNIDASIVSATALVNREWSASWDATHKGGNAELVIESFSGGCSRVGLTAIRGTSGRVFIPGNAAWVAVFPRFPAVNGTWHIG